MIRRRSLSVRFFCYVLILASLGGMDFPAYADSNGVSKKILRVAVSTRTQGLGNPYRTVPIGVINPNHVLYDALTSVGDGGTVLPALAASWKVIDKLTWLFELKPDIKFSNGEAFSAKTVHDVITYLQSKDAAGYLISSEISTIESVEIVDELIIKIKTKTPDAILPKRLSLVFMIPMDYWNTVGVDEFNMNPSGSGPFKLMDWGLTKGTYVFERNDTSWRKSLYFDEIHFTPIADVVSRTQALISDQIDLSSNLSLDLLDTLSEEGFETIARTTYSVGAWAFKQIDSSSPVADLRVRRALNMAIDRMTISSVILKGVAPPISQVATPNVFGHNPNIVLYPYDPEGASKLLKEAGYGDGLKLRAIVRSDPSVPESVLIYQIIAQNFAAIGVDVEMKAIPGSRWLGMYFSGDWEGADLLDTSFNNSSHGDAIRSIEIASCLKAGAFFCDKAMLPRIKDSNQEFNVALREEKLQQLVADLHYNPPALYLFPYFDTIGYSQRLAHITLDGPRLNLENISLRE
ncbi:MAG: hypothetical protein CMM25_02345 [Rhodospirillaceae bacterium]|nr:hypothetical protein [Rhodospirillaceae bacterium]